MALTYLKNKKIILTGGAGFLGQHVLRRLLAGGVEEKNITIPRSKECDLRHEKTCQELLENQDIVIHLAAQVGGIGHSRSHPGEFFYDNAAMSLHLLEAFRKNGGEKFVGVGSVCSYPKLCTMPFKEEDLWEGYPEETNAAYGLAKKMMLVQSQAYREQYGTNAIHLLLVNLYGPGDNFDPESCHVIPALIQKIAKAKKSGENFIEVWGSGEPTREFLYVEDAAEGIVLAAENYNKGMPVNIGAGQTITIKDLVLFLSSMMGFQGEIRWDTSKPDGQPKRLFDVKMAETEFGFKAKTDFETGLQKTIQWFNKNLAS